MIDKESKEKSQEIALLIRGEENYLEDRKNVYKYVRVIKALKNESFDADILTEEILNDKGVLHIALKIGSVHTQEFKCKVRHSEVFLLLVRNKYITDFSMIEEHLLDRNDLIIRVLLVNNSLYKKLPEMVKEKEEIFRYYVRDSSKCIWDDFPEKYKTKENALTSIRKNVENVSSVCKYFPELKNSKEIWKAISHFYIEEASDPIYSFEKDFSSEKEISLSLEIVNVLREESGKELLKKLSEINEIFIPFNMLLMLNSTKEFGKYLKEVNFKELNKTENYSQLLRQEVLKITLESKNGNKEENNKPMRIKVKV